MVPCSGCFTANFCEQLEWPSALNVKVKNDAMVIFLFYFNQFQYFQNFHPSTSRIKLILPQKRTILILFNYIYIPPDNITVIRLRALPLTPINFPFSFISPGIMCEQVESVGLNGM